MNNNDRIKVKRLAFGDTTKDGAYYATVDGKNVGENGRTHWKTESAARDCGFRFLVYQMNFGKSDEIEGGKP